MVRCHTAFGYKWLRGLEGIKVQNSNRHGLIDTLQWYYLWLHFQVKWTDLYSDVWTDLHITPSPKMYWLLSTHIDWSLIRTKLFTQFCYWTFFELKSAAIPVSWSCEKFAKVNKAKRLQFPREITAHRHRWRTVGMLILYSFGSLLCFRGNFILNPLFGCWLMCFS